MMKKFLLTFSSALLALLVWLFVGADRLVGDHEMGVSSQLFIKHRPTLRLLFENPAQHGLDLVPFEELTPFEQQAVIEYCEVRYGLTDIGQCYLRSPLGKT